MIKRPERRDHVRQYLATARMLNVHCRFCRHLYAMSRSQASCRTLRMQGNRGFHAVRQHMARPAFLSGFAGKSWPISLLTLPSDYGKSVVFRVFACGQSLSRLPEPSTFSMGSCSNRAGALVPAAHPAASRPVANG